MGKVNKFIYWIPRVLGVIFILFLALMSLDVFDENAGFWGTVLGLFMHNIPDIVLLIILIISWKKYEIVGGIIFIVTGIAHMVFSVMRVEVEPWYIFFLASLIIDVPAFLIGILFLVGWFKKKSLSTAE